MKHKIVGDPDKFEEKKLYFRISQDTDTKIWLSVSTTKDMKNSNWILCIHPERGIVRCGGVAPKRFGLKIGSDHRIEEPK